MKTKTDPWLNDAIQFPRLLAEIHAMGLHEDQIESLATEMDLPIGAVYELLDRATEEWDRIKSNTLRGGI